MTRLHVLGLPHTQTTKDYITCAYTTKTTRFCNMMTRGGYEVILYAGEHNEAEVSELVTVVSDDKMEEWFGPWDPNALPSITWNTTDPWWSYMNQRCIEEIEKRKEPGDILCISQGLAQKPVGDPFPEMLPNEWGIGYEGVYADLRVYESYAWMHYLYGRDYGRASVLPHASEDKVMNGKFYYDVIPNFFEPDGFHLAPKEDYLLFVGRLIQRKGPHIASIIAEKMGMPLVIAGAGATVNQPGLLESADGVRLEGDHIHYVGPVNSEQRAKLMAGARALLAPTLYIGPFEGVTVEAMLSGTPAVTTDYGVFTETVEPGLTGERFHILREGVKAVEKAMELDPEAIRKRAISRYSLDAVFPRYDAFYQRISTLLGVGWAHE